MPIGITFEDYYCLKCKIRTMRKVEHYYYPEKKKVISKCPECSYKNEETK